MGVAGEGKTRRRVPVRVLVAAGAVLAVLLVVVALFVRGEALEARLDRRKAELRAAGHPVSTEDVVVRRDPGTIALLATEELARCLADLGNRRGGTSGLFVGQRRLGTRRSHVVQAMVRAELSEVADEMALLRARVVSVCGFPLPESGDLWLRQESILGAFWPAAIVLSVSARVQAEAGDATGAGEDLAAILRVADTIGDEPLLVEHLAMAQVDYTAVAAVEEVLGLVELPPDALAVLQTLVAKSPPSPRACLLAKRALGFSTLESTSTGDLPSMRTLSDLPVPEGSTRRLAMPRHRAAEALVFDELMEESLDACVPDLRMRRMAADELLARLRKAAEDRGSTYFLTARLMDGTATYLRSTVEHETALQVAATALAVEQWRAAHGAWPESLEELVPQFLPKAPEDPYSEAKLLYRRADDGVLVYSVGPDGVDDGGVPPERAGLSGWRRGRGWDLPFRLLDAERRGAVTLEFRQEVMGSELGLGFLGQLGFDGRRLRELGLTEEDLAHLRER